MVVVFVTGIFAQSNRDSLDGMSGYVYKMSRQLKMREIRPIIVAPGNADRKWTYRGISVHTVRVENRFQGRTEVGIILQTLYRDYRLQKEIRRIRKDTKIDLIQYTGWYGIGILHKPDVPSVLRVSSYTKVQLSSIKTRQEIRTLSLLERIAARNKTGVIAPSYAVGKAFEKDIRRRVTIIETPFWDELDKQYHDAVYRQFLQDKEYLLFFGRMTKDKGIYEIADILNRVLSYDPDLFFCFAGIVNNRDGEDIHKLLLEKAGQYRQRIILLKKLPHESLYPVIRNAKLVLLPSRMDNFPNACAEAMNFGRIVIGTDGTSLEQFITDGINGYLAEPGNAESLCRKVIQALSLSEEDRVRMGNEASKRIGRLSPDIMVPVFLKYYKHIIRMYDRNRNRERERGQRECGQTMRK